MTKILVSLVSLVCFTMATAAPVVTEQQSQIRPSFPFPDFLSTAPYTWHENTKSTPIKGHTYRVATFINDGAYNVYIEKVHFGTAGCCLEIVDYRRLSISKDYFAKHFPSAQLSSQIPFKLVRWLSTNSFEFDAFGGKFVITKIDTDVPEINLRS